MVDLMEDGGSIIVPVHTLGKGSMEQMAKILIQFYKHLNIRRYIKTTLLWD